MISTMKKMWKFLRNYKFRIVLIFILLILGQVVYFFSPILQKTLLDDHLTGIEYPWVEISSPVDKSIKFHDKYLVQTRYLSGNEKVLSNYSLFTQGSNFYVVNDKIPEGTMQVSGNKVNVYNDDKIIYSNNVAKLTKEEVKLFYSPSFRPMLILLFLMFFRIVVNIFIGFFRSIITARVNVSVVKDLRFAAAKKIHQVDIQYLENEPAGKTSNRIIFDSGGALNLNNFIINVFFRAGLGITLSLFGMFYLNAKLATFFLVIITPLAYLWMKYFTKAVHDIAWKVNEFNSLIIAQINEMINGISILQIFNYKKESTKKFNDLSNKYKDGQMKEIKMHLTGGWNLVQLLRGLSLGIIIIYFGWFKLNIVGSVVTAGLITAYVDYITRIFDYLRMIFAEFSNLEHSVVKVDRILYLIEQDVQPTSQSYVEKFKGDVSFKDIYYKYNENDNYVLNGINIDIKRGQTIGLVGHTGSGKSTLMNLLVRFNDLKSWDKGNIVVDNFNIRDMTKKTYRQHVGIILQEPILFRGTFASNIRFGKEGVTDWEINEIIDSIGARKIIDKYPDGIYQKIDRSGNNLSVGEKQLISFARALVYQPSILVLDEATANMDTETEIMIQEALEVVSKDRTMIVIAHRLSTIREADNIFVLDHGNLIEQGNHNELIKQNGIYANMYRSQVTVETK